jgi:hypothetical protein
MARGFSQTMTFIKLCIFSLIAMTTVVKADEMKPLKVCGEDSQWFPHVFTSRGNSGALSRRGI